MTKAEIVNEIASQTGIDKEGYRKLSYWIVNRNPPDVNQ